MRFIIASSMIILLGLVSVSCGGTNKASRTVTVGNGDSYVSCNQNYWYAYSGCMPPSSWTVTDGFVLPAAWYPSTLDYTYPSWYTEAGLKVSFRSTCHDVGNCNQRTLQDGELYPTDPNTREDVNTVYHHFSGARILSGITNQTSGGIQWSNNSDPEMVKYGYGVFESTGKLDVSIMLLPTGYTYGSFDDYLGTDICTTFSTGYSKVTGTIYARRMLADGSWETLNNAARVHFSSDLNAVPQTLSLNKANQGNATTTNGKFILEIHDLAWNGQCLYDQKNSTSGYNHYCSGNTQMEALPKAIKTDQYGNKKYACVKLEIGVSWNAYTPNLGE